MHLKIAILTPLYGPAPGKFVQCLADLFRFFYETPIYGPDGEECTKELQQFIVASSMLTESRHKLVAEAVYWGATHMLWLDGDHVFPGDSLHRLLSHNLPLIGCNYSRRCIPTAPTAATMPGEGKPSELLYTTREKAEAGEVEPVAHTGFGLCLMHTDVLTALQNWAEEEGLKTYLPLFQFSVKEDGIGLIGEDKYFFDKCRKAGVQPYVDHALSWEVGHIGDVVMTSSMAVAQRDDWEGTRKKARDRFEERAREAEAQHAAALEGAAN